METFRSLLRLSLVLAPVLVSYNSCCLPYAATEDQTYYEPPPPPPPPPPPEPGPIIIIQQAAPPQPTPPPATRPIGVSRDPSRDQGNTQHSSSSERQDSRGSSPQGQRPSGNRR